MPFFFLILQRRHTFFCEYLPHVFSYKLGWILLDLAGYALTSTLSPMYVLQVGMKLRICGAELASSRPIDPLDPSARTACLRLSYNGTSPAAWDAKLGLDPMGATLR